MSVEAIIARLVLLMVSILAGVAALICAAVAINFGLFAIGVLP